MCCAMLHLKFAFGSFCMCLFFGPLLRDPLEANTCDEFTHSLTQRRLALCFPSTPQFACSVCCILYSICVKPHTHTHTMHFVSLWTTRRAALQRSRAVQFNMWCHQQGDYYLFSSSCQTSPHLVPPSIPPPSTLCLSLYFHFLPSATLCSAPSLLFFSRLLHLDTNSLIAYTSFLLPLLLKIYWIYIHPSTQFSVLVTSSSCHCCMCVCIYTRGPEYGERD